MLKRVEKWKKHQHVDTRRKYVGFVDGARHPRHRDKAKIKNRFLLNSSKFNEGCVGANGMTMLECGS